MDLKRLVIILALLANTVLSFADKLNEEQQKIVSDFIDLVKTNRRAEIAKITLYPLDREYPVPSIMNETEFLQRFDEVFDDSLIKAISRSVPADDWAIVGWRGIMLHTGQLWLSEDGMLVAVNYQSQFEEKKKEFLIASEKEKLHESLKTFERPILILETSKFRIRIDDLGNGNFRYASWPLREKMSVKPDLIIENGTLIYEGSGGNCRYTFKNSDYTYDCEIIIMGADDSPPAQLTIYKGDKEILSQKAIIVGR